MGPLSRHTAVSAKHDKFYNLQPLYDTFRVCLVPMQIIFRARAKNKHQGDILEVQWFWVLTPAPMPKPAAARDGNQFKVISFPKKYFSSGKKLV